MFDLRPWYNVLILFSKSYRIQPTHIRLDAKPEFSRFMRRMVACNKRVAVSQFVDN